MPRIKPTRTVQHGRHLDEYWPGLVYSTWNFTKLRIRRERCYADRTFNRLKSVTWQVWLTGADTTGGWRIERRDPRTRNW